MDLPVLLVSPPAKDPVERFDTPNYPAMGIGCLAAYLSMHGMPVRVIDGKLDRLTVPEVIEQIVAARPRILGLSSMTQMVTTTHQIAAAVKERCPDTIVVLGGTHATFLPERTLREFPAFDYLCVGEGEIAFHAFVTAVFEGRDAAGIPGIASRCGSGVRLNGRGEIVENLDSLGMPAWHLFPRAEIYPVMTHRGCPFACNFCSRPYGRRVRYRSPEHVVAELKRNNELFGCRNTVFYDETLTVRKEYILSLCQGIEAAGLRGAMRFWGFVHARTIDLPTAKAMKHVGFDAVGMGAEAGSERVLRAMGKGLSMEDIVRAARIVKHAGLRLEAFFIIGHPHETIAEVNASIRLATRINPDLVSFGLMTPYPGTGVWDLAIRGDGGYKMITSTWEDFDKQIGKALELKTMSRKTMERLQLKAYLTVYLRNFRFGEMLYVLRLNRRRIMKILKKLILPKRVDGSAASAWIAGEARSSVPSLKFANKISRWLQRSHPRSWSR